MTFIAALAALALLSAPFSATAAEPPPRPSGSAGLILKAEPRPSPAAASFTALNAGSAPLTGLSAWIYPKGPAPVSVHSDCPKTLAPGARCSIHASWPKAPPSNAVLSVASQEMTQAVSLSISSPSP